MSAEVTTTAPLAVYRRHAAEGRLAYQYSPAAGRPVFFPRLVCPYTGSTDLEWRISTGRGVVYAASTVVPPRDGAPYNVALVDVEEGFRMMSTVVGVDPDDVSIGLPVSVAFIEIDAEPVAVFHRDDR